MIQELLLKLGATAAVLAGVCTATWFAADAHYSQALSSLEGQLKGAADAQNLMVEQQKQRDAAVAKDIDNEAKAQIGSMAGTIGDLSKRLWVQEHTSHVSLCPSTGAANPRPEPERPGPPASPGAAGEPPRTAAILDPAIMSDAIDLGIDAIRAELFWRAYARRTGQVNAP